MNDKCDLFSQRVLNFLSSLSIQSSLPRNVEVLNPYRDPLAFQLCKNFYAQYYADTNHRRIILGINPGRFGAGLTGIPFTDPIKLETICDIKNDFDKKAELSADFIYKMIAAYGGAYEFYKSFYFSSVSPLGFTRDGKNLNYYDDKKLTERLLPFIVLSLNKQLKFGLDKKVVYCLGEGENYKFLFKLNEQHHFFENIIPLAHPRFIMQYKRKSLNQYIDSYLKAFSI
ncbi:MAG: DUF4918 family protein [Cyclobacteriaceae bacterium]|nr:DUF4918 family protein [Cyclobacteriaceae bacterium]